MLGCFYFYRKLTNRSNAIIKLSDTNLIFKINSEFFNFDHQNNLNTKSFIQDSVLSATIINRFNKILALHSIPIELQDSVRIQWTDHYFQLYSTLLNHSDQLAIAITDKLSQGNLNAVKRLLKEALINDSATIEKELTAQWLFWLAHIHQLQLQPKFAVECLQKALKLQPDNLLYLTKLGEITLQLQQYQDAIQCLSVVNQLAKPTLIQAETLANCLLNLAKAYRLNQQLDLALAIQQQVLTLFSSFPDQYPQIIANIYAELADSYLLLQQPLLAIQSCEQAIKIREQYQGKDYLHSGIDWNQLATVYLQLNNYTKAIYYLELALAFYQQKPAQNTLIISYLFIKIAEQYRLLSDNKKAIKFYEQAYEIVKELTDTHAELIKKIVTPLAEISEILAHFQRAIKYYELAWTIHQIESNHDLFAITCLTKLGELQTKAKHYAKAKSYFEQLINICHQYYPNDTDKILQALEYLAENDLNLNDYQAAIIKLQSLLELKQKYYPDNWIAIEKNLQLLATSYQQIENNTVAIEYYQKINHLYQMQSFSIPLRKKLQLFYDLALCYQNLKQYQIADQYYQQALSLINQKQGNQHPYFAIGLIHLAQFYHETEQFSQALICCHQAKTLLLHFFPENHPELKTLQQRIELLSSTK